MQFQIKLALVTVEFILRVLYFGNDVLFEEKFYTALCQGNHSFCWSSEKARKHSVVALLYLYYEAEKAECQ